MFYVYVLKSARDGNLYLGSTNDLKRRLREHNDGEVASTRGRTPFELVYYEAYRSEHDARMRESRLKLRSKAFAQLKRRIIGSVGLWESLKRPRRPASTPNVGQRASHLVWG